MPAPGALGRCSSTSLDLEKEMSLVTTFKDLTEQDVLDISARLDEPDWLRDRRQEAFKAFSDLPWPTPRDEEWRYTRPSRFDLERPLVLDAGEAPDIQRGIVAAVADQLAGSARIVDGAVVDVSSGQAADEAGVVITDLATAALERPDDVAGALGSVVGADEKFDALNLAAFSAGVYVSAPAEARLSEPIGITVTSTQPGALTPRVLIHAGPHAELTVYVDHVGGAEATVVEVVEVVVEEGATVRLVTSQDWEGAVAHMATHRGQVGDNANYHHLEVTLGGETVYIRPDVELSGAGGNGELLGLYFGSTGQMIEHRSLIHHDASHTSSTSVYKGALQGESRAAWLGNIRIEPHAKATSSDETNRNLILTEGAKADSVPFLEILTSDVVQCGHHSSVGQVDELQLFYLESRGISREEAARLLVFGFFAEVLGRVDLPGVTDTILGEIEQEILTGPTT